MTEMKLEEIIDYETSRTRCSESVPVGVGSRIIRDDHLAVLIAAAREAIAVRKRPIGFHVDFGERTVTPIPPPSPVEPDTYVDLPYLTDLQKEALAKTLLSAREEGYCSALQHQSEELERVLAERDFWHKSWKHCRDNEIENEKKLKKVEDLQLFSLFVHVSGGYVDQSPNELTETCRKLERKLK